MTQPENLRKSKFPRPLAERKRGIDPLSTARGFRARVETLARDPKALGPRVCFVHTGGIYGVFPERVRLGRLVDR